jgi:chemotaxis protein MotB
MASGGGGAWKVAYADFVTAMMAFFMVMWLTSQKPEVAKAVAEHFKNPGGKRISGSDAKSMLPTNNSSNGSRRVVQARGTKKSDGDSKVKKMHDEGDKSNVGTIVPFVLNTVELTEEARESILELLPELQGKQHLIEVRGHSASSGGNSSQANLDAWNISYKRSMVVAQFLVEQGIDARRIRPSQAGSSEPKFAAEEIDHSNDSRVEVFVLSDMFEEPSAKIERLVSTKSLGAKAKSMDDKDKAAAAPPAKSGH